MEALGLFHAGRGEEDRFGDADVLVRDYFQTVTDGREECFRRVQELGCKLHRCLGVSAPNGFLQCLEAGHQRHSMMGVWDRWHTKNRASLTACAIFFIEIYLGEIAVPEAWESSASADFQRLTPSISWELVFAIMCADTTRVDKTALDGGYP